MGFIEVADLAELLDLLRSKGVSHYKQGDLELVLEPVMDIPLDAPSDSPILDELMKDDTTPSKIDEREETDLDRHNLLSRM